MQSWEGQVSAVGHPSAAPCDSHLGTSLLSRLACRTARAELQREAAPEIKGTGRLSYQALTVCHFRDML